MWLCFQAENFSHLGGVQSIAADPPRRKKPADARASQIKYSYRAYQNLCIICTVLHLTVCMMQLIYFLFNNYFLCLQVIERVNSDGTKCPNPSPRSAPKRTRLKSPLVSFKEIIDIELYNRIGSFFAASFSLNSVNTVKIIYMLSLWEWRHRFCTGQVDIYNGF